MVDFRENRTSMNPSGLGKYSDWPDPPDEETLPIDLMEDETAHARVRDYVKERIDMSEREMSNFYDRWRYAELRTQAYITLEDREQQLKEANDGGSPPKVVSIQLPYAYATLSTVVTYILHTFAGRKPMFPVGSIKQETAESSHNMELILQYNADHTRLIRELYQFLWDAGQYGLGVMKTAWDIQYRNRTVQKNRQSQGLFGQNVQGTYSAREYRKVYEGNEVKALDPFMFFPDPRVPMTSVNRNGEFVFWRSYTGRHKLLEMQANGQIKYVDKISDTLPVNQGWDGSNRAARTGGASTPGAERNKASTGKNYVQIDQGTITLIPAELGIGTSHIPEKWMVSLANKTRIIQLEPFGADHDMHPVAVTEPFGIGYGFGQLGLLDYLSPIQDTLSWFINSHIYNVRSALNNMFIYDPSMIEGQDLKNPEPNKLFRLKRAAYGVDVRTVIQQIPVQDVTRGHVADLELFGRIGDALTGVNDNLRGQQDPGGRKTATEVRTSGEAAASRLAALARVISAQAMTDLAEQMCLNIQQHLTEEFYIMVLGVDGMKAPIKMTPEQISADFYFPVHDGTLPLDKVALLDAWKEIFLAIQADPELRQNYSLPKVFEWIAELGGARNIESFKLNVGAPGGGPVQPPAGAMPVPGGSVPTIPAMMRPGG